MLVGRVIGPTEPCKVETTLTMSPPISELLATLTAQRLRDAGIQFSAGDLNTLRIPACKPEIGDIIVSFEDDEVSVFIGDITHSHFALYEADDKFSGCTNEQAATDAVQFISEVVADKWIIWLGSDGRGGCFKPNGSHDETADAPLQGEDVKCFQWSGKDFQ